MAAEPSDRLDCAPYAELSRHLEAVWRRERARRAVRRMLTALMHGFANAGLAMTGMSGSSCAAAYAHARAEDAKRKAAAARAQAASVATPAPRPPAPPPPARSRAWNRRRSEPTPR